MKRNLYTLVFLTVTVLFFSCKTAKKMYEKGNYDEAVELAAKQLQKKPNDAATLDILQNAYRFAVEDHENRIRNNSTSTNELRSEWNYNEYLDLQRLYDAIRRVPSVYAIVHPTDYSSYIVTFQEEASNARYDRGLALMENNTRNSYKQAYQEFQRALDLKPGDLSAKQKRDEAYANAVINVVIQPIVPSGYHYTNYNNSYGNFDYNIIRYLTNSNGNLFVRYYSAAEANSLNVRVDQIVEMRFSNSDIDHYRDQRSSREVSRQVVVKEIVIKPDSVVKEYATVKARINTTRKSLNADGLLQVTVRDYNNKRLWSDTYRGDYNWSTDFSSFTGDARALSDEDKKLLNRREEFPPHYDDVIQWIMNEVQNKAGSGIRDYFNRF